MIRGQSRAEPQAEQRAPEHAHEHERCDRGGVHQSSKIWAPTSSTSLRKLGDAFNDAVVSVPSMVAAAAREAGRSTERNPTDRLLNPSFDAAAPADNRPPLRSVLQAAPL